MSWPRPPPTAGCESSSATTGRGRCPASPTSTRSPLDLAARWWRSVPKLPKPSRPPGCAAGAAGAAVRATGARAPHRRGRGAPMPFSKGRMAQALVLAGARPRARLPAGAADRARGGRARGAEEISIDQLHGMVEEVLAREEGAGAGLALPRLARGAAARSAADARDRRRDRHGQEHACDRDRLPARHQPHHLHRRHPPGDAGVLRPRADAGAPLLVVRRGRGAQDADARPRRRGPRALRLHPAGRSRWPSARMRWSSGRCWRGSRPSSRACMSSPGW